MNQSIEKISEFFKSAQYLEQNYILSEDGNIIGSGNFGKVYLYKVKNIHNDQKNQNVAIKIMNRLTIKQICDKKTIREFQILNIKHNNLVEYLDIFFYLPYNDQQNNYKESDEVKLCLVMELMDGDLKDLINDIEKEKMGFGECELVQLFLQICHGVFELKKNGIYHRDLKPANIMYKKQGNDENKYILKIGDFNTIRQQYKLNDEEEELTEVGTNIYKAPEYNRYDHEDQQIDLHKADIYSLGITFIDMIRDPNTQQDGKKLNLKDECIQQQIIEQLQSKTLESLLKYMINKNNQERPTIEMVILLLETVLKEYYEENARKKLQDEEAVKNREIEQLKSTLYQQQEYIENEMKQLKNYLEEYNDQYNETQRSLEQIKQKNQQLNGL